MNAAAANSKRLLADAELLFQNGRFPTAFSIAVLSIEEAGKPSILRGLSIAPTEKELNAAWRDYRTHTAKNYAWIIVDLARNGARTINDLRPMFDRNSDHTNKLDSLKQMGFYTDCYGDRNWAEPQRIIDKQITYAILYAARILCPQTETSAREIELWIEYLCPHWGTQEMIYASIRFHEAMRAEGLGHHDADEIRRFFGLSPNTDK